MTKLATAPPLPRYAEVARALGEEIAHGIHPAGTLLPTESALGARFSVSRHTIRAAIRLLREERLVSSRQGHGSTVSADGSADPFRLEASSIDDLVAYSKQMYTQIRSSELERVDGRAAARIGVAAGGEWLVVRGIVLMRQRRAPVCGSAHFINRQFAALQPLLPRISGPLFLQIEELFGIRITEMDQTISTTTLGASLAEPLRAKPGEPAVQVRRTYRTGNGMLAQISLHTHPASRFQQTIKMRRPRS